MSILISWVSTMIGQVFGDSVVNPIDIPGASEGSGGTRQIDPEAAGKDGPLFELRPLRQEDFHQGFLETLASLAPVDLTPEEAIRIWRGRNAAGVRTVVAVQADGRVIGTASLILEHKFIHGGGTIGHIEDVAVHPDHQGKGIGSAVVLALVEVARQSGCYKVILSCNDANIPFYVKLGFRRHDNGMRMDLR